MGMIVQIRKIIFYESTELRFGLRGCSKKMVLDHIMMMFLRGGMSH